jgi:xylose isomerase
LKEKACRWNTDKEIQAILKEINPSPAATSLLGRYSKAGSSTLLSHVFDKDAMLEKQLPYERLDQLTIDILTGTR